MRLVASRSMLNARHSRTDRVHAQKQLGMGSALRCTIGPREDDPTATQHSQHANRQRAKRKERKAPGIPLSYDKLPQPRKCQRRSNTILRSHRERDKRARKKKSRHCLGYCEQRVYARRRRMVLCGAQATPSQARTRCRAREGGVILSKRNAKNVDLSSKEKAIFYR